MERGVEPAVGYVARMGHRYPDSAFAAGDKIAWDLRVRAGDGNEAWRERRLIGQRTLPGERG